MFVLNLNKVHSYVDIITNSSTVIYTWSEGSVEKAKDLLSAMFDLFGHRDVNIEEEFSFGILPEDFAVSRKVLEEEGYTFVQDEPEPFWENESRDAREKYFAEAAVISDKLKEDFVLNNGSAPEWFAERVKEALEDDDGSYYRPSNTLVIIPKNDKYKDIIDKMISFLYSTVSDGERDG